MDNKSKQKRTALTLETKYEIIKKIHNGVSKTNWNLPRNENQQVDNSDHMETEKKKYWRPMYTRSDQIKNESSGIWLFSVIVNH
jgi:CENP-B-like protein